MNFFSTLLFLSWGLTTPSNLAPVEGAQAPTPELSFTAYDDRTLSTIHWTLPMEMINDGTRTFSPQKPLVLTGRFGSKESASFRYEFFPNTDLSTAQFKFERLLPPGYGVLTLNLDYEDQPLVRMNTDIEVPKLSTDEGPARIKLMLPEEEILFFGRMKLNAETFGKGIKQVRYRINGETIGSAKKAPYQVKTKLGSPKVFRVEAEALDAAGKVVARDEKDLNGGPYSFNVRLLEPLPDINHVGMLRAEATVRPPMGRKMQGLTFYVDETPVGTVFSEPYSLFVPVANTMTTVKAEGRLDRTTTAEDSRILNAPEGMEFFEVRNIDLYITVEDRYGDVIDYLDKGDFKIFEDDKEMEIREFVPAEDRSMYLSFLVDVSGSMSAYVPVIIENSRELIEEVFGSRDRASLTMFRDNPELITSFTGNKYHFYNALHTLEQKSMQAGMTAFYDGLISALYDLNAIEGRRALLIFSDGEDNASRFWKHDVDAFAKQAGVRFYFFNTQLSSSGVNHWMLKTAKQTGGNYYHVRGPMGLVDHFQQVKDDLETQYLIRYQTTRQSGDTDCRKIRVEVSEAKAKVRTIQGYCP